jgi:protein subunit release factor A
MKNNELEISICSSPKSPNCRAEVGIMIKHIPTGVKVKSIKHRTQHLNKLAALELLSNQLK